ncbi:MFS transporter [Saccharothrix obliqua]|uniref:MFS transporter n=1 Tax=Saccharothrix obliqua TaxID=2861747 RepID=UPI001C5D722F|nr:MFS transporter [Saccharothrix obliqua]MBW4721556.1 MFS transporter [Saccharothrix obliqua]
MAAPTTTRPPSAYGLRLGLLALAQFIVALDFNIVYVALPDIGRHVGFSIQSLQWVVSAYVVVLGGFLLFGGRAADRLGTRRMFVIGAALYAIASLVGGLATDPGVLIAGRAVQGVGGALLTPATLRLIFTNFTEGPERNRAFATWGAAGSAGLSAGALLGGVLTNYLGWEWVFFVNVPLGLFAAFAAPSVFAPDQPRPGDQGGFDLPGAIIATLGASAVVFGLVNGPEAGWLSVQGVWALAAGLALLAAFLVVESRTGTPLMPLRLFRVRGLGVSMGVAFTFQGATAAVYYLLTTYFQDVLGYSPLAAGLAFLPPTLVSMVVALSLTARLLTRWGIRRTLAVGLLITAIGTLGAVAAFSATGSYWALLPGLVLWGFGGGLAFSPMFAAAGVGVAPLEQGVASAMANTSRQIGGSVGLALLVALVNAGIPGGVAGLRVGGWFAVATTLVSAAIALVLRKPERATA